MQTSLLNFFTRTPKGTTPNNSPKTPLSNKNTNNGKGDTSSPVSSKPSVSKFESSRYPPGSLVWSKLQGYPWWPSMVCNHPTENKSYRKGELHVQFFDDPVTRSWVNERLIKPWGEKVQREGTEDATWEKGLKDAEKVKDLSNEERLDALLVTHLPSDEEWDDMEEEVSPGSKENKPVTLEPQKKRRRIIEMDSDDSGDDETFKPSKKDLEEVAKDEEEMSEGSGESEAEPSSEEEEDSPVKSGAKRKRNEKSGTNKKSKVIKPVSTPVSKVKSGLSAGFGSPGMNSQSPSLFGNKSATSSPLPNVNDSTKKKLAMFGAASSSEDAEIRSYKHNDHHFLQPDKIKDRDGKRKDDPDYNPRTLYVPDSFLKDQTPAQRQWWELKSQYFDVILFFKMGKFYELFHMDADVGVAELNIVYMKGDVAHAGFPEVAYGRYAATLVEKGYKVARIEQTETPATMEERVKSMSRPTKFDKVVAREVCQLTSKGTRVNNYLDSDNFEGEPRYLLAIDETNGDNTYGVAFVDTTIGMFHLGQFKDDKNLSRLRTLTARYPPVEILYEKGGLSNHTLQFLSSSLSGVRREGLKKGAEFWESDKTLNILVENEYFKKEGTEFSWPEGLHAFIDSPDSQVVHAKDNSVHAIRALGALVWYLSAGFLDQELLSLKKFEEYRPVDAVAPVQEKTSSGPTGKYMVLDGITIRNLDLVTGGDADSSLLSRLDSCLTAMGKRTLRHWVVTPLLQPSAIRQRQTAVKELMELADGGDVRTSLKKIPDLERLISKIHTAGDAKRSTSHPDSRAVMFEGNIYSKRKIMDLLQCLDGFKQAMDIVRMFQDKNFESKMLKNITHFEAEGGEFPDLTEVLNFFENAFDHNSARKEGKIIPSAGVDEDLDSANNELGEIKQELDAYLKEQKKHFGCEVKYWGTGKNRFQIEIPMEKVKKAGDEYRLASGTKKLKRYTTATTEDLLARQIAGEECKEAALQDIQRKMFHQFSSHATILRKAIGCLSLLDSLLSLAAYSNSLESSCFPEVCDTGSPCIDIKEGRHPCLDLQGEAFIPNDTYLGNEKSLIILTGPNMGGKSTLMRQTGLLVVLAQIGCMVPAEEMKLNPVDRIFTRLGAQDNIIGGESTFLVELQETSTILQHATNHSLVLVDELGRGTATYDGTAIAGAVVKNLAARGCRTLFATHYHTLCNQDINNVFSAHMACMVENEGHEDITQENITFLYKLVDGPAPKSHGFNAAKLAGLPDQIIRRAFAISQEFASNEAKKRSE